MKYKLLVPLTAENLINKSLVELEDILLDLTKLKKSGTQIKSIEIINNNIYIVNNLINNNYNKSKIK